MVPHRVGGVEDDVAVEMEQGSVFGEGGERLPAIGMAIAIDFMSKILVGERIQVF